jgi:tetratricopeptide (TPR) repeat protein
MSSALAQRPQVEFVLVVLTGSERGTQYKLVGQRASIGRGSDNDIVIKDDSKMSRNHAVIALTSKGAEIADVSERNKLLINGKEVSRAALTHGSIIQLGETKLQFKALSHNSALEAVPDQPAGGGMTAEGKPRRMSRLRRPGKSSTNFYILVGIIAVAFVALLTSQNSSKIAGTLKTDESIDAEINDYKQIVEKNETERTRMGMNTRQYEEAQPNFIKGFRDYRKGQYGRAIESFQACLSLFPDHIQCNRYKNLSQKKFDELIQYHMILASKYMAQNQFSACKASYRNAMIMIKEPSNKIYLEAKAGFDACDSLEGDRY